MTRERLGRFFRDVFAGLTVTMQEYDIYEHTVSKICIEDLP